MNLLVVSTWYPYPADNGSRLRAFHLLRELAKCHRIHLITGLQDDCAVDRDAVLRGEHPAELAGFCERIEAVPWVWHRSGGGPLGALRAAFDPIPRSVRETPNPAFVAAVQTAFDGQPDALLGMELGVDPYLPDAFLPSLPVVLDQVEVSGGERAFKQRRGASGVLVGFAYRKGVRYKRSRLRRYTALTAVSDEEAGAVRRLTGDSVAVHVVPNGVDVSAYSPRDSTQVVPGRILYNGALGYAPNADAVRWFACNILPVVQRQVPEAHLVVTGRKDIPAAREFEGRAGIHLTGMLPDLRAVLAEAALVVAPLLVGGGTRLKILEAWAAGVPVVSTTVGAAGLAAQDGTHLLLADDSEAFAARVSALLRDPQYGAELAANAYRHAEARFDWTAVGEKLANLLESLRSSGVSGATDRLSP